MWRIVASALGLATAVGCGAVEDGLFTVDGDFSEVEIRLTSGDLEVFTTPTGPVEVLADFGGLAGAGDIGRYIDGNTLILDYACVLCGGDLAVAVPSGMGVSVELGTGELSLDGLDADLLVDVGRGDVHGVDLAGEVAISTRAGVIDLQYGFRPAGLLAETSIGAIDVEVPPGLYDLRYGSQAGRVVLDGVAHQAGADSVLGTWTEAGAITLTGR